MQKKVIVRASFILGILLLGSGTWLRVEAKPPAKGEAKPAAKVESKPPSKEELGQTFNGIYSRGDWARDAQGKGTSGSGSTLDITREYRAFIEDFIKKNHVKSVVDAGCGDWEFSSATDWNNARYLGIDISSDVIEVVKKKYQKDGISFTVGDVTDSLPSADLLLCKDVLQHLPNALIIKFIKNNLKKGKYKWAILTNDRGGSNVDIPAGQYRMIDLSAPPFKVKDLQDLPIKFGGERSKLSQLLSFRQPRSP
jgi:SAM-dependent methyltransferase